MQRMLFSRVLGWTSLLFIVRKIVCNYDLITIEHFSEMDQTFLIRSTSRLDYEGMLFKPISLFDREIKLRLKAGYAIRYQFPPKTLSARFFFDSACPFPIVFKDNKGEFLFKRLDEKKIAVTAGGIGISDLKSVKDAYDGATYSSAPKDYQQVGAKFLQQFITFETVKRIKPISVVVYCPFLAQGYRQYTMKMILRKRVHDQETDVELDDKLKKNFSYKNSLKVGFRSRSHIIFPFVNFTGTAWFNRTTDESCNIVLSYMKDGINASDNYISGQLQLSNISNLTVNIKNPTNSTYFVDVEVEGADYNITSSSPSKEDLKAERQATNLKIFFVFASIVVLAFVCVLYVYYKYYDNDEGGLTASVKAEKMRESEPQNPMGINDSGFNPSGIDYSQSEREKMIIDESKESNLMEFSRTEQSGFSLNDSEIKYITSGPRTTNKGP